MTLLAQLLKDENGATVMEVSIISGLIAFTTLSAIVALDIKFLRILRFLS